MPRFLVAPELVEYTTALQTMGEIITAVSKGADEVVWFLEHPSIYTAGTSSKADDLLRAIFPVHQSARGGQYTYHGPGQLVIYVMLDLKKRNNDVRAFVHGLETWAIQTLANFGLVGKRKPGLIGVWLDKTKSEAKDGAKSETTATRKIAAIGVRVTKGVTWHGLSLNISPDLSHYRGIIPCGLHGAEITSLHAEGIMVTLPEVIKIMRAGVDDCGLF